MDTGLSGICQPLVFSRGHIPERRMPSDAVVIGFDIFKDFSLSLIPCQKSLLIHDFSLEVAKERLSHRIVPAVTLTAHTLNKTILLDHIPEAVTGILHPTDPNG